MSISKSQSTAGIEFTCDTQVSGFQWFLAPLRSNQENSEDANSQVLAVVIFQVQFSNNVIL